LAGQARFSSLVAAPGHGGLIRVLLPVLFPQDRIGDLRNDVPLETVASRSVPMACGPNVDQAGRRRTFLVPAVAALSGSADRTVAP
jgi:hypothetical protein